MSHVPPESVGSVRPMLTPWYRELTGYHWFVFIVCTLSWMFDCLDQRFFVLARGRALEDLLGGPEDVKWYGSVATALLLIGWATGGIIFGVMGDRLGRAKTLMATILVYSMFTGLSALSVSWWDFCLYRFLTGLGIGGAFAAAVTLIAEVMPSRARPHCLGMLQAFSAVGNIAGSLLGAVFLSQSFSLGWGILRDGQFNGWRILFLIGTLPALLVVVVMLYIREPDSWLAARDAANKAAAEGRVVKLGSWRELLGDRRWRKNLIVGILLVTAGAVGLWGIGFWTPELIRDVIADSATPEQMAEGITAHQDTVASYAMALQDVGAFFGMIAFTALTARIGRRVAFGLSFSLCFIVVFGVFGFMNQEWQIYYFVPLVGFATLSVFGGYAIYLPELFPTRLRSTGTSLCYNAARYLTAIGVFTLGLLTLVFTWFGFAEPFRWAACTVAFVFLAGIVVLPFAPETKDQPLPE
ncbi:MAG: MFS transporter [Pirellulaceae bacterium]